MPRLMICEVESIGGRIQCPNGRPLAKQCDFVGEIAGTSVTTAALGAAMTQRGQALFDRYVSDDLESPTLKWLTMELHAFRLTLAAEHARIPSAEIVDEVGPLIEALGLARLAKFPLPTSDLSKT